MTVLELQTELSGWFCQFRWLIYEEVSNNFQNSVLSVVKKLEAIALQVAYLQIVK